MIECVSHYKRHSAHKNKTHTCEKKKKTYRELPRKFTERARWKLKMRSSVTMTIRSNKRTGMHAYNITFMSSSSSAHQMLLILFVWGLRKYFNLFQLTHLCSLLSLSSSLCTGSLVLCVWLILFDGCRLFCTYHQNLFILFILDSVPKKCFSLNIVIIKLIIHLLGLNICKKY